MAAIKKTVRIFIRRPIMEVFSFIAEPGNFSRWQPFVVEAALTSKGPMRQGTTYRYCFQALGQTVETTGKITEYKPHSRYLFESTNSPFFIKGGFLLEEVDGFTRISAFGEVEPAGYFQMAQSIIGILLERQLHSTLRNLKEILEGRA